MRDSNPRPCACKAPALPAAPIARICGYILSSIDIYFKSSCEKYTYSAQIASRPARRRAHLRDFPDSRIASPSRRSGRSDSDFCSGCGNRHDGRFRVTRLRGNSGQRVTRRDRLPRGAIGRSSRGCRRRLRLESTSPCPLPSPRILDRSRSRGIRYR